MTVYLIHSGFRTMLYGPRGKMRKNSKMELTWSSRRIEHNLEMWQNMQEEKQELWVGRGQGHWSSSWNAIKRSRR